jgi:peptidoglycan L-alanyl-D-glutamate endopeptidase CwlK
MRDYISINRAANLHPKVREEVVTLINKAESLFPQNMAIRIVQGLRTIDEQNALYAQGRTKPGKVVTNAPGGKSYHNYGLAIDFAILKDKDNNGTYETLSWETAEDFDRDGVKDWLEVVKVFKDAGWKWGGDFLSIKDNPHFEKAFGYKVSQLLALYNKPQRIAGTPYVNF